MFGGILPHCNAIPMADDATPRFKAWWQKHLQSEYPMAGSSGVQLSVDWYKGLDSCSSLVSEVRQTSLQFQADDGFAEGMRAQYRRFLKASLVSECPLSPGALVDLTWHAHMTSPIDYEAHFGGDPPLDHEPCGEENPPDAVWLQNSNSAWERLFPGVEPPSYGSTSLGGCCCCGGPPRGGGGERREAERREAERTSQRWEEVARFDNSDNSTEAKMHHQLKSGCPETLSEECQEALRRWFQVRGRPEVPLEEAVSSIEFAVGPGRQARILQQITQTQDSGGIVAIRGAYKIQDDSSPAWGRDPNFEGGSAECCSLL